MVWKGHCLGGVVTSNDGCRASAVMVGRYIGG